MERTSSGLLEVSEIELVYKSKVKASERPQIVSSKSAYEVLLRGWDENKIEFVEQFKDIIAEQGKQGLGVYEVSTGGISGTVADPRLIFVAALKANASSMILAHNHPSGNLKPSRQDEELTAKIREAGRYLEIKVLDHLIITNEAFYSFADEGIL